MTTPAAPMMKSERALLDLLQSHLGSPRTTFDVGGIVARITIGANARDDCAAISIADAELVVTTDYVRGTGFRLFEEHLIDYRALGRFLTAANLSDVAAMGARAIGLLTIIRYGSDMGDAQFAEVIEGINELAMSYDVPVLGGDIGGATTTVLAATALGLAPRGQLLRRSGMRPGDDIYVSGHVGKAAAALVYGLFLVKRGQRRSKSEEAHILAPWRSPEPRLSLGRELAESGLVTSCQDISDGLRGTLQDLLLPNGFGAVVEEVALPVLASTSEIVRAHGGDPLRILCGPSPDFELCFTAAPSARAHIENLCRTNLPVSRIGSLTTDHRIMVQRTDGRFADMPGEVWNQQNGTLEALLT